MKQSQSIFLILNVFFSTSLLIGCSDDEPTTSIVKKEAQLFDKNTAEEDAILLADVRKGSTLTVLQDYTPETVKEDALTTLYLFIPGLDPSKRLITSLPRTKPDSEKLIKDLFAEGNQDGPVYSAYIQIKKLEEEKKFSFKKGTTLGIEFMDIEDNVWTVGSAGTALLNPLGLKEFSFHLNLDTINRESLELNLHSIPPKTVGEFNKLADGTLYLKPAKLPSHLKDSESIVYLPTDTIFTIKQDIDSSLIQSDLGGHRYILFRTIDPNLGNCTFDFSRDSTPSIKANQKLTLSRRISRANPFMYFNEQTYVAKCWKDDGSEYTIGELRSALKGVLEFPENQTD